MSTTALPQVPEAGRRTRHATSQTTDRELDHRISDGIDVTLRWNALTDVVTVVVRDDRLGDSMAFGVGPADALRAFHHPYAYAATSGARHIATPHEVMSP